MGSPETALAERKIGTVDIASRADDVVKLREVARILNDVYTNVLQKGTDYGTVPGSSKPSLWKPGAELLCRWLHMVPDSVVVSKSEPLSDDQEPYFSYVAECKLYSEAGGYLGNGFGACNSKEPGYAFRWVYESDLPPGLDLTALEKRTPRSGGVQYKVPASPNEIFGKQNDIVKKAKKRAFVDAVLTVTGASRIFTQDIEDEPDPTHPTPAPAAVPIPATGGPLTKEQLEYELRDYGEDVAVVEEQDGLKVEIRKKLTTSRFDALATILGTYKAIKGFQGQNIYFSIKVKK